MCVTLLLASALSHLLVTCAVHVACIVVSFAHAFLNCTVAICCVLLSSLCTLVPVCSYTSPGRRSYHPLTDYIKTPTQFSSFTQKLPYLLLTLAILVALITCTALFVPRSNHMALLSTASISDLSFNQDSVGNTVSFSYTLYTTLHNRNFVSLHLQSVLIFANLIMNQTMAQPPVDSTVSNSSSSSSSLGDSLLSTIAATASSLLSPLPASTLSLRSLDDPSLYLVPLGRFPDFTSATVSARDTQTVSERCCYFTAFACRCNFFHLVTCVAHILQHTYF